MKRIISVFISIVVLMLSVFPLSAFATEEKTYECFKYIVENGEIKITGCIKEELPAVVEIPSEIDGIKVTTIGEKAFFDTAVVSEYILPDTIITIEKRAFNSSRGTEKINIPDGVKTIGDGAFGDCSEMLEAIIPDSVESFGERVFKDCESLRVVKIPDHFTKIPAGTFDYCEDLYNFVIPDGVTEIGESAFNECVDIVSINIPKSVKSIGDFAFYCCEELGDVYYSGTEAEWKKIKIGENNASFTDAEVHYKADTENYTPAVPNETSSASYNKDEITADNAETSVTTEKAETQEEKMQSTGSKLIGILIGAIAVVVAAVVIIILVAKKNKTKK